MSLKIKKLHRRKARVRKRVYGTPERPRLSVARSNSHIYAQIIDDLNGKTLLSASSRDPEISQNLKSGGNIAAAKVVGELLGKRAKDSDITKVVFDRGGRLYHGRVQALAESSRSMGLQF